jgi:hypothetical protein
VLAELAPGCRTLSRRHGINRDGPNDFSIAPRVRYLCFPLQVERSFISGLPKWLNPFSLQTPQNTSPHQVRTEMELRARRASCRLHPCAT